MYKRQEPGSIRRAFLWDIAFLHYFPQCAGDPVVFLGDCLLYTSVLGRSAGETRRPRRIRRADRQSSMARGRNHGTFPDTFFSPYVLVWHGVVFTLFEAFNIGMIGIGLALLQG